MNLLTTKIWSHLSLSNGQRQYVRDIRDSSPKPIRTYKELVDVVAKISFNNPSLNLAYRGQRQEHKSAKHGTSIYPSIFRKQSESRASREYLGDRYRILDRATELLNDRFKSNRCDGRTVLRKFPEVGWAILQHYEICNTPLLDITSSLRVACSFALRDARERGIVYILGLPHTNGSISFYADEEQINLRLLSICPPVAMRPHFQEGYLVGTFPTKQPSVRSVGFDVARRLVAKFEIEKKKFWDRDFQEIPMKALFPQKDEMERIAGEVYRNLVKWASNNGLQPTLLPWRG